MAAPDSTFLDEIGLYVVRLNLFYYITNLIDIYENNFP
jgi:hypothetical protein